jgi:DNA-binding beta-propeller fold protein YncE
MRHLDIVRAVALATALCAACSQDLIQTPTRNLDRPTDVAFVCMSRSDAGVPTPVAGAQCATDADAGLPSATLYGFVTNTARGEVALVDLSPDTTVHLVDLDPRHPGYGFVPVGKLPSRIAASSDGCRVATANTGTCDLSIIDTGATIAPSLSGTATTGGLTVPRGTVARVQPRTAAGLLAARPREVAFVPGAAPDTCSVDAISQLVVTFPRCGLVAVVEVPTGRIVDSMRLTPTGLVPAGTSPWCPSECGAETGSPPEDAGVPDAPADAGELDAGDGDAGDPDAGGGDDAGAQDDAGAPDGGGDDAGAQDDAGTPTTGTAPKAGGLAISADGKRVYVAADDQPLVYGAALDAGMLSALAGVVRLDSTTAGVRRLRLSPPFDFDDVTQSFLYAFSGDRSVHVILAQETREGTVSDELVECETNPDPRIWVDYRGAPRGPTPIAVNKRGCVRLDDNPPRKSTAKTPGITLASGVPKDVAFQKITDHQISLRPDTTTAGPTNLNGTFGWLGTSRGTVGILNILPDREAGEAGWGASYTAYTSLADPTLVMAHQIRNLNDITLAITDDTVNSLAQNVGPPRVYAMTRLADGVAYTRPDVFRVDEAHLTTGKIAQKITDVYQDYKSKYDVAFPDVSAVRDESWTISFRGTLPGSLRATGNIDASGSAVEDRAQVFCELGTQPGDFFILTGCVLDSQCAVGEVCVSDPVAPAAVTGLCFPEAEAETKRTECYGFLSTIRYYRVARAYSDLLQLAPAYEIRNLPGGCDPTLGAPADERCNAAAPTDMPEPDATKRHYRCEAVPWPSPAPGECVRDCDEGRLCGEGYACDAASRRCVAGPVITPEAKSACLGELVNYALQAGDGYTVYGNYQGTAITGFLHRIVRSDTKDATDHYPCVDKLDLTTDPVERARLVLEQGRIPLLPPPCTVDPLQSWPPAPNPCRVDGVDEEYLFVEGSSAPETDKRGVKVYYANPVVNVGFLLGRVDEEAGLVVNPPPSFAYAIEFDVGGWYIPYSVSAAAFLPETVVAGPDGYIYVVDSGLDIATSGLRGQLLRLDPSTGMLDSNFIVR